MGQNNHNLRIGKNFGNGGLAIANPMEENRAMHYQTFLLSSWKEQDEFTGKPPCAFDWKSLDPAKRAKGRVFSGSK